MSPLELLKKVLICRARLFRYEVDIVGGPRSGSMAETVQCRETFVSEHGIAQYFTCYFIIGAASDQIEVAEVGNVALYVRDACDFIYVILNVLRFRLGSQCPYFDSGVKILLSLVLLLDLDLPIFSPISFDDFGLF